MSAQTKSASARPLAALLAHLDSSGRRPAPGGGVDPALLEAAAEAARRAGYAEGLAEGERRLAEERLRAARAAETRLAEAREAWTREEAGPLAERITQALATLESDLVEGAAATLRPLLPTLLAEAASRRMAEEIRRLVGGAGEEAALRVVAPADLIARLRAALGETAGVDFVEGADVDAVAALGRSRIETRLAAWAARLAAQE